MGMTDEKDIYINKVAIMQVLAGLINNPLLFMDNRYRFDINDFQEQFHRIVFGAIEHLVKGGIKTIDYIDIDKFLQPYAAQYKVFTDNRGIEYIQRILKLYDANKFDYYYKTLKKYSLLVFLNEQGFETKDIYDPDIVNPTQQQEMQAKFDEMSINDILLTTETKLIKAKEKFESNSDLVENNFGDGILDLIEELKETPEMGMPLCSPILTTLYRGQRLGCLVMDSAPSGTGKTRRAVAEACHLAVSEYWDDVQKQWVNTGFNENVLVINTELELSEIQTIAIAYVSGVAENKILDGKYYGDEEERVHKAARAISSANLYFVSISNFDCDDVINIIKKYHATHKVNYIYFDYLSENMKMLAEGVKKTKIQGLRTDQILNQFSTALKDCAKQLGIYIWTSSQLSNGVKDAREPDSSYLKSAKSLAEKLDIGSIMLPIRELDQNVVNTYIAKGFELEPNFVIHIYKIRRGTYQNIRFYVYFDRSTGRLHDCFVTNNKGEMLEIKPTEVEVVLDKTKEENLSDVYSHLDFSF